MSETKMSDDEMKRLEKKPLASFSNDETASLWMEADRARRSEEEKDATIKALVDVMRAVLKRWKEEMGNV